jgi:hypothetical protein
MTPARPLVAHYSRFGQEAQRHGGVRRSEQLREILEQGGMDVVSLALATPRCQGTVARLKGVTRGFALASLGELGRARRLAGLYHLAMSEATLRQVSDPAVPIVWEGGPGEASYGAGVARRLQHRVIAVPQNFDSLNPGMRSSWSGRHSPVWFDEELGQLRLADAAFVLSDHDRWLLALHGVHAHVLPYHPPIEVEAHLLGVRRRRTAEAGLRALLELPNLDLLLARQGLTIVIAGYGTEHLRAASRSARVTVEGSVSDARRDELLLAARALLVHGAPATAVLTRIPEALVAGVPVIANRHAVRGAEGYPGVHVYDDADGLAELLGTQMPMPPSPERPVVAERRFAELVRSTAVAAFSGSILP